MATPFLSRSQVREVDRLATERYHIPSIVLMENAARGATEVAEQLLKQHNLTQATIFCGGGNNGGDGLAIARHLHIRGHCVTICLATDPTRYDGDALMNYQITQAMNLATHRVAPLTGDPQLPTDNSLLIDALLGTGLTQPPREPLASLIPAINNLHLPILSIDLPSGLDCDTGLPLGPCIRASHTITFVAPKIGFSNPASRQYTGEITIADIGAPLELIDEVRKTIRANS